ncbi:exported hypothetical protein [Verrucomicrobia bacterium]|nr:exported hypothetical protein [Verrucomicrobiota bacterium]
MKAPACPPAPLLFALSGLPLPLLLACAWPFAAASQSTIVGWGYDGDGEIDVPWINNAVALAAGRAHSLALCSDGTVVAWGADNVGQIDVPPGPGNVVAIAAGANHSLAVQDDGTVAAWGDNTFGQTNVPSGLSNVVAVAAGLINSLALKSDGTVALWGWFATGPNNVPAGLSNVVAIGAGDSQNLAVKADGTVAAWVGHVPYSPFPLAVPATLTNAVAACGVYSDNLALCADGTVIAWGGDDSTGQTNVPPDLTNVVEVSGGDYHSVALQADGTVVAWGAGTNYSTSPNYGQSEVPAGLQNVVAVAAGGMFSLALVNDGAPFVIRPPKPLNVYSGATAVFSVTAIGAPPLSYQWQFSGTAVSSAVGNKLVLTNVQTSAAGTYSVVVSNAYGSVTSSVPLAVAASAPFFEVQPDSQPFFNHATVTLTPQVEGSLPQFFQWQHQGTNLPGATNIWLVLADAQRADTGNYALSVSNAFGWASSSNAVLALTHTRLVAWGDDGYGQTNVPPVLSDILQIAVGSYHSLALKSDGTVAAWGAGATTNWGVVNDGQAQVPSGLSNVIAVSARDMRSLALQRDGTLVGWGYGGPTNTPPDATNLATVGAGSAHNLALRADGTVLAWGDNSYGQTNLPVGLTNVVAIAAGAEHSAALKADGTVVVWGDNSYRQTNIPPNVSNLVAIAAGDNVTVALQSNGTVVAWGDTSFGVTPAPPGISNVVAAAAGIFFGLALQTNGAIVTWGGDAQGETNVPPGLPSAVAVGGGYSHGVAVVSDGSPFLTQQPVSQTLSSGMNATFTVRALGAPPLCYQWQFDGRAINGATNNSLTLANISIAETGNYCVIVSNSYGSIVSTTASLNLPGLTLTSPGFASPPSHSRFGFVVNGLSGRGPVIIIASSNLSNWYPIFTNSPIAGSLPFSDPLSTNQSTRFYRAVEQ